MKHIDLKIALLFVSFFALSVGCIAQELLVLSLKQAVSIGMQNSYAVKQAQSRLAQSQHQLKAWRLRYSSNANLSSSAPVFTNRLREVYDYQTGKIHIVRENNSSYRTRLSVNQPILFTDGTLSLNNYFYNLKQDDDNLYQTDITLNYNQPLFKISKRKISMKQAEINLQRSSVSYYHQKRELGYRITEQFLNLLKSKRNLELAIESAQRSREVYKLALTKYNAGLYSEMDLLRIKVDLSNDENTLLNQEENYEKLLDAFKLTIGLDGNEEINIHHDFIIDTITISEEKLFDIALKNSPERILNELEIKLDELDVKSAKSEKQFMIDMNLEYGVSQNRNRFADLFHKPEITQIASINFNVPLWDSGQNHEQVLAAKENAVEGELRLKQSIEQLRVDIKEIILSLTKSRKLLEITERTEADARKSYQYSVMQFNSGSITSDELSLAKQRLNTASTNNLNAKIEYLLAVEKVKMHSSVNGER